MKDDVGPILEVAVSKGDTIFMWFTYDNLKGQTHDEVVNELKGLHLTEREREKASCLTAKARR